jgi:hypothetical protein
MQREKGNPPKISLILFDIWLTECDTGMLTFRQIAAGSLALLRIQQILSWSSNSSNFVDPKIYYPFSKIPPAVCNLRRTKPVLSLPLGFTQRVLIL